MDFFRFLWISLDFNGFQLISMDLHRFQCISMDFNGFPWISMDFNGFFAFVMHPPPWFRNILRNQRLEVLGEWSGAKGAGDGSKEKGVGNSVA